MNTRIEILGGAGTQVGRVRKSNAERFTRLLRTLALWQERARQRRALSELSDELLKDIGVSRADAEHEAGKSFWQD